MNNSRHIPEFKSREEEAAFWDSHDITDHLGELKPVEARFSNNLSKGTTVRFDPETTAALRVVAKEQGIGPTTLIRMWVLERLRETRQR